MTAERRLIINADDLGYDPEVTRGILRAMREGVVSCATLMVNTPTCAEAAGLAKGLSLGLHFNLSRWAPLSQSFPITQLNGKELTEAAAPQLSPDAVASEVRAQLARFLALTRTPATHIDVHKHLHRNPNVLEGIARAAEEASLPVRSLDAGMRTYLRNRGIATPDHFAGEAQDTAYWTLDRWQEVIFTLPKGVTEIMCHPGYCPSTLASRYGVQREVELATLTSPAARHALERAGVVCVDFRSLRAKP
jgi:predicted glycoside hydrolase/deacetylase ChbG (UPF0249 family)